MQYLEDLHESIFIVDSRSSDDSVSPDSSSGGYSDTESAEEDEESAEEPVSQTEPSLFDSIYLPKHLSAEDLTLKDISIRQTFGYPTIIVKGTVIVVKHKTPIQVMRSDYFEDVIEDMPSDELFKLITLLIPAEALKTIPLGEIAYAKSLSNRREFFSVEEFDKALKSLGSKVLTYDEYMLLEASSERDIDLARMLLEKGTDPNFRDSKGFTPLLCLIHNGGNTPIELIKLFLEYGADVNTQDDEGWGLLHQIHSKEVELYELALEYGIDISLNNERENKAIHFASTIEGTKLLISAGADPEARDKDGKTPLHLVCKCDGDSFHGVVFPTIDFVRFYVKECGVNFNAKDHEGKTPMDLLPEPKNPAIVEILSSN